ncbi:flagellar export protein FliJ [Nocardioides deserti]|uniref:Flagellar FliJ family protein n=1 Tax=Nocardioides deserti TaxID=1588644 RepID=A0ABR6UC84_9ACTN|nr:flagellar export protein FliJ [Nocardioides deserti]MBC2961763.1 flagellar FliJ family protein [Nocardioides deserti]GGO73187.1 hypothetical protein GCM10012276_18170 [Nocardioides deserti]
MSHPALRPLLTALAAVALLVGSVVGGAVLLTSAGTATASAAPPGCIAEQNTYDDEVSRVGRLEQQLAKKSANVKKARKAYQRTEKGSKQRAKAKKKLEHRKAAKKRTKADLVQARADRAAARQDLEDCRYLATATATPTTGGPTATLTVSPSPSCSPSPSPTSTPSTPGLPGAPGLPTPSSSPTASATADPCEGGGSPLDPLCDILPVPILCSLP